MDTTWDIVGRLFTKRNGRLVSIVDQTGEAIVKLNSLEQIQDILEHVRHRAKIR